MRADAQLPRHLPVIIPSMLTTLTHSTGPRATFARFAGVGGVMALIDGGVLYALHAGLGVGVYAARLVSFPLAMTVGYFLNRHFTFRFRPRFLHPLRELLRFYAVHSSGGVINYATFAAIIAGGSFAGIEGMLGYWLPLLGVVVGGVAGMCFNFVLAGKLVFQAR